MGRYANTGEFNVLYPTRRRMATILKRIIRNDVVDGQGTLVESIRINAKITGFEKLEIQIIAMYYFIYLNNGVPVTSNAYGPNSGSITPRDYVNTFTYELNAAGITAEIYSQYTEWLSKKFPILQVAEILEKNQRITYTFYAIDPPSGFNPSIALDV
jgi:hypothetical protein